MDDQIFSLTERHDFQTDQACTCIRSKNRGPHSQAHLSSFPLKAKCREDTRHFHDGRQRRPNGETTGSKSL